MGNAMIMRRGGKAKVMNINGELFKLRTPARAGDITKDHPGHVLIDSRDFGRFKLRAQPLDPHSELQPNKTYLLVQLPRLPVNRSGGHTTRAPGTRRSLKVRLPKAEVQRIVGLSRDDVEAARRIIDLCIDKNEFSTVEVPISEYSVSLASISMCSSSSPFITHHHLFGPTTMNQPWIN